MANTCKIANASPKIPIKPENSVINGHFCIPLNAKIKSIIEKRITKLIQRSGSISFSETYLRIQTLGRARALC